MVQKFYVVVFSFIYISSLCADVIEYISTGNIQNHHLDVYDPPILFKLGVIENNYKEEELVWAKAYKAYTRIHEFDDYIEWKKYFSSNFIAEYDLSEQRFEYYKNNKVSKDQNPEKLSVIYSMGLTIDETDYLVLGVHQNIFSSNVIYKSESNMVMSARFFVKEDSTWKITRDELESVKLYDYLGRDIDGIVEKYKFEKNIP